MSDPTPVVGQHRSKRARRRWIAGAAAVLGMFGPGLIAANAGNDAGGVLTYANAGSQFTYDTLFLMVLITVALVVVQEMCSRLGVYAGEGLAWPHQGAVLRTEHVRRNGPAADCERGTDRERVRGRWRCDADLWRVASTSRSRSRQPWCGG